MTDPCQFNVNDAEGRLLCPACGFPNYAPEAAYDEAGGLIGVAICPCCLWEPGFDDEPAASAAAQSTILGSLRAYRAGWGVGGGTLQWKGSAANKPANWDGETQLANLFQIAPKVR